MGQALDSPTYDPAWRYRVAEVLAGANGKGERPVELKQDGALCAWLEPLRTPAESSVKQRQRLLGWHQTEMRGWLEALLLTDLTYTQIAAELGGVDPADVALYQQVFYNVRDTQGAVIDFQRKRLLHGLQGQPALTPDDVLKRGVLSGGTGMLGTLIPVYDPTMVADKKAPDMTLSRLVDAEVTRRVLANTMDSSDLIRLQSVAIDRSRQHYDLLDRKGERDDGWAQMQDLMQVFAPRLIEARRNDIEMRDQKKALERKLMVENRIRGEPVTDKGPDAMADLGRRMQQRFAEEDPAPAVHPAAKQGTTSMRTADKSVAKAFDVVTAKLAPVVNQLSLVNFPTG